VRLSQSSSRLGVSENGRRASRPPEHAFTLLEILLALAIIALIGTVLIGGSASLLSDRAITPTEVFWKTVQECRKTALKTGKDIRLTFAPKEKKFVLADASGREGVAQEFAIPSPGDDLVFTFLTTQKGASMIMLGGVAVETQTLPSVTFYSDGTCTPFRAQIQRSSGVTALAIDPWTCAAVLTPPDPNAP
jgi:prepilin-type N-terminal cleavage/methylation domain-containing protein